MSGAVVSLDELAKVFSHVPVGPEIPRSQPNQRYFPSVEGCSLSGRVAHFQVLRFADQDVASLRIDVLHMSEVRLKLSATELLQVAKICIDAAHDLEANSAESLAAASAGAPA